ncbi:MAG: nucleotide exchange factor GrpE [Bifidobacteriaceae bacterium]|jgi:molecular chaperone GrpE|nr:nucleotide exchange factor GrpE [Bifidobacteriaceae bacterium]
MASSKGHDRGARPSADAPDGLGQRLDNLDEDLAVEEGLGVDPDDLAGDGGGETNWAGRPVIRDNRKVDPISGRARKPDRTGAASGDGGGAGPGGVGSGGTGSSGTGSSGAGPGGTGSSGAAQTGPAPAGRPDGGDPAASDTGLSDLTPGDVEAAARALEDEVVAAAELISAREELAVRTEDLQRLSAEYANYRKRVDRDRAVAGDQARAEVLTALIPVLDDIDAARTADELDGPFKAVAEKLEETLARFGLERYGAVGEAFDPTIHEALLHQTDPAAEGPAVSLVLQPGYRMGERVLRAARVGVVDSEG